MTKKTETADANAAPPKEELEAGQSSIIIDGREMVFKSGQKELPGMPEVTRLRQLGLAFVDQTFVVEQAKAMLDKVKQETMMELRNEGRSSFAMRENGVTYIFNINAPQEKLEVKKKR